MKHMKLRSTHIEQLTIFKLKKKGTKKGRPDGTAKSTIFFTSRRYFASRVMILFMMYNEYILKRNNQNQAPLPLARRRRLADGCHHVFIDAGANIGVQ